MTGRPLFSVIHPSARPDKWRTVYEDWMRNAEDPRSVEYVLVTDPRWGFSADPAAYETALDNLHVVQNTGRRCYVDAVNAGAQAATGLVLIVIADDQFSESLWDKRLRLLWEPVHASELLAESFVVEASTGTPQEHDRGVMVMPILSRKRYEDQGSEVFFHGYESMAADNDFCEWARQDGVVIDARHLMFPHKHPLFDGKGGWKEQVEPELWDQAYRAQNSQPASELGRRLLAKRRKARFTPVSAQRSVCLCIPGEVFRGEMLDCLLALQAHLLLNGWEVQKARGYTSNVYVTREDIRRAVVAASPKADLVLWLDDDNPITIAQFNRLVAHLEAHAELDGVAGWCWIHNEHKRGFTPSVGLWAPDHLHWDPFPSSFAREQDLKEFECGGMPCLLMRSETLEKSGDASFMPLVDNRLEHGLLGEDFAFFLAAEKAGCRFAVDPTVRLPHLKYVEVEPILPEEGAPPPVKVACMIRAKNEARWIGRTLDSVKALCGDLLYVMEDGSTDGTREVAEAHGAVVWDSPFAGQGLDESRDKDWLLQRVIAECSPDWIFMPDGDEELEAGGCEKIRRAVESNPPIDCFALRFLYLWDSVDQVRLDGVYGTMARQSLFRADSKFHFKSYYATGNQNHVGLHTSNAPGLGGRVYPLNVALLHYGYLHRADRIRKYRWITNLDPVNEHEGFYLHCVQGDIPEVPADQKLKHAGPLQLRKLPPHLIPKFDTVPGPLGAPMDSEVLA